MNYVTITGTITDGILVNERNSGVQDFIPINAPNTLNAYVTGMLRSENIGGHVKLYIEPQKIISNTNTKTTNEISLSGYICKTPIYRKTPLGKEITNIILATGEDYIPLILWGSLARATKDKSIGEELSIKGRIQSREYLKDGITHATHEVSCLTL